MSETFSQFKTRLAAELNATASANGIGANTVISENSNGELLTDAAAAVLDSVNTVSPNNIKYPKSKT